MNDSRKGHLNCSNLKKSPNYYYFLQTLIECILEMVVTDVIF